MAPRRSPRTIALDSWAEKADFQPEVERLIVDVFGGRFMHPKPATVRKGQTITPTNVPWPDLTIWFPERDRAVFERASKLYLVELKSHDNPKPRGGQPELFASLAKAGQPVFVWEPRDLDDIIIPTFAAWSRRPWTGGLFVPRALRLRRQLAAAA